MSLALSSNIDEKSLSWNNNSLIDNNGAWVIVSGEATFDNEITLGSSSEINLFLDCQAEYYKANYLKLLGHLTCDDKTLSTDNVHNVCVLCEVIYLVEKDGITTEELIVYEYYPKYDFEENYKSDYTILKALNSNIKSISVSIINYEEVPVVISKTALYISSVVDEGTVNNVVVKNIEQYVPSNTSCIDVLDADPDPTTVPNGINAPYCYMWILSSSLE